MAWNKELEASKILLKEKEQHRLFVKHKDGRPPTPYIKVGYCKESTLQSDFFTWAKNSYISDLAYTLAHVPNEGDTAGEAGAIKGGIRLAMGVLKGFPDVICVKRWPIVDLAELKLPGEKLSTSQIELHEHWSDLGIKVEFIDNFKDWRQWIEKICS